MMTNEASTRDVFKPVTKKFINSHNRLGVTREYIQPNNKSSTIFLSKSTQVL
jgi:hypothetical protein